MSTLLVTDDALAMVLTAWPLFGSCMRKRCTLFEARQHLCGKSLHPLDHRMEMQHQHIDACLLVGADSLGNHVGCAHQAGVERDHGALVVASDIAVGDEGVGLGMGFFKSAGTDHMSALAVAHA